MGGLTGGGGGGGGSVPANTTTTQKSEPWIVQQPYLETGLKYAQSLFANQAPPAYYAGNTVAPFSPETATAQQLAAVRALSGSPLQTGANQYVASTLAGQYLPGGASFDPTLGGTLSQKFNDYYQDPTQQDWFKNAFQAASDQISPQISSRFAQSGRLNSGLARAAEAKELGNAFAGLALNDRNLQAQQFAQQQQLGAGEYSRALDRYQNLYNQERAYQQQAASYAPQLAQQDYNDFAQLAQIGGSREQLAQNIINEQQARYNYNANAPQQQLMNYLQAVSGNLGSQSTATQNNTASSQRGNPILGGLGGALTGYAAAGSLAGTGLGSTALGATFAANPLLGAGIGAGLGILGGLF